MNEIEAKSVEAIERTEWRRTLAQVGEIMRGMAEMLASTNERITALEQEIRTLTKVTPAQVKAINAAIRERAAVICCDYSAVGCEQLAANAIRKALRLTLGISAVREIPRCDYNVAMRQVEMWDDYKQMKSLKAGTSRKADAHGDL